MGIDLEAAPLRDRHSEGMLTPCKTLAKLQHTRYPEKGTVRYSPSRLARRGYGSWFGRAKGERFTSEAAAGGRGEMEQRLIRRSLEDDVFRQRLLADPRAAVEQELGTELPPEFRIQAMEETADTIYLVLPRRSADAQESGELSDRARGGVPTARRARSRRIGRRVLCAAREMSDE